MENWREEMGVTEQRSRNNGEGSSSLPNNGGFPEIPLGVRFCPTDQELITDYLAKKIQNQPFPANIITEVNIYDHHPENLPREHLRPELYNSELYYCFTPRELKKEGQDRWNRKIKGGVGYWKICGHKKKVYSSGGSSAVIGSKSSLTFYEGETKKSSEKSKWFMWEYTLPEKVMKVDDCVLCKIYNKQEQGLVVQGKKQAEERVQGDVTNANETGGLLLQETEIENRGKEIMHTDETGGLLPQENHNKYWADMIDEYMGNPGHQQFPDMSTSLPHQMSYTNLSSSFGFGEPLSPTHHMSYNNLSSSFGSGEPLSPPVQIVGITDELSPTLTGFVNPIRGADIGASSSNPDYAKGSHQLEPPSYTAPTQHISMGNQGNLQDISPQLSQEDDYNMVNADPSTQSTGSAHPQPRKRTS